MEGRSLSLFFLYSTLVCAQFARSSPINETSAEQADYFSKYPKPRGENQQEKCMKNGGAKAYKTLLDAEEETTGCLQRLFNNQELKNDVKELTPTGKYNFVISKYCGIVPELKACADKLYPAMEQCLNTSEKAIPNRFKETYEAAANFICHEKGSAVSSFIKAGGLDCVKERIVAFDVCVDSTSRKYTDLSSDMLPLFPLFKFGPQECRDVYALQECAVTELKKCKSQAAANFAKSLFSAVQQVTCIS